MRASSSSSLCRAWRQGREGWGVGHGFVGRGWRGFVLARGTEDWGCGGSRGGSTFANGQGRDEGSSGRGARLAG
eukprot:scaffold11332_cov94-Isochrysis_galbana.AAC.7